MTNPPDDARWIEFANRRIDSLLMPRRALGKICDRMVDIVRIQRTELPACEPAGIIVLAGDHGVATEGVSAYPSEVTGQMIRSFQNGGAAISVLARQHGLPLFVVDMGSNSDPIDPTPNYLDLRIARGTTNFLTGPAMTREQVESAVDIGWSLRRRLFPESRCLIPGEMGIGNTTSASALSAILLGYSADEMVGRGTGIDDSRWKRKVGVVAVAQEMYGKLRHEPFEVLAAVGGFEIAGLVGLILEAAESRTVVLLDGFIVAAAALAAVRIDPRVREVLVASHRSREPGHQFILNELQLEPMVDLDLCLGEASGAALVWPILNSACRLFNEMATFAGAGVSGRRDE